MNPYRSTEENMSALKKVLTQRTLVAIANKNVEFVLKNQNASLDELAEYLCKCRRWCGHIPGRTEVIGGDFIDLRFRGWAFQRSLPSSGSIPRWRRPCSSSRNTNASGNRIYWKSGRRRLRTKKKCGRKRLNARPQSSIVC